MYEGGKARVSARSALTAAGQPSAEVRAFGDQPSPAATASKLDSRVAASPSTGRSKASLTVFATAYPAAFRFFSSDARSGNTVAVFASMPSFASASRCSAAATCGR
jgi:hypothetical protein